METISRPVKFYFDTILNSENTHLCVCTNMAGHSNRMPIEMLFDQMHVHTDTNRINAVFEIRYKCKVGNNV